MNKEEFFREIEKALDKISETERAEILYDYEEHFMIGKENGKTEEEICLELGSPREIANNYLLNRAEGSSEEDIKEEPKKNSSTVSKYSKNNSYICSGIAIAIVGLFFISYFLAPRHSYSKTNINSSRVEADGFTIDESGIHGNGISIDENGVKVPGVRVDENGVRVSGIRVDSNGVKAPGVSVDSNGVKVPGVSVDEHGVNIDLPDVKIDIKN
jgi:hypothetical protein